MRMRRLIICMLVAASGGLATNIPVPASAAVSAKSPEQVAREFYSWYFGLMIKDKEPTDDPARYAAYVSASLRARIKRQIDSPDGMDADYFIKAQDYLPDWPGHISTSAATVSTGTAHMTVTLGTDRLHPWRLGVSLVRDAGQWRLSSVQKSR